PRPLPEVARHVPQGRGPRVFGVIDPMSETGNLLFPRQLAADDFLGLLGRGGRTNVEQQAHDVRVGAAVERALQRRDRGDDGGVNVGQRGGGNASGKGGGVELVVRVQDQRHV